MNVDLNSGNRQQATGNRQQATGNRQQATGNRQDAVCFASCCGISLAIIFQGIADFIVQG